MSSKDLNVAVILRLQDKMSRQLAGTIATAKTQLASLDQKGIAAQQALYNRQSMMYGALMKKSAAGAMALIGLQGAAYKAFIGHEKDVAYLSTLIDDVNVSLDDLSVNLRGISRETGKTMHDVMRAAYQSVSSGVDPSKVVAALEVGSKTAVAGDVGIEVAMAPILSILNAYNMETERAIDIADKLFATVNFGVIEFGQLSNAVSHFSGTAATGNFKLEETLAALAALTKAGITPDMAGTSINRLLQFIIDPQEEAKNVAKSLGLDLSYEYASKQGLIKFLQEVEEKANGSVVALTKLFPEERAFKAAAVLAGSGARNFAAGLDAINSSAGAMEGAFDKMAATDSVRWDRMKQQLGSIMVDLGKVTAGGLEAPLANLEKSLSSFANNPEAIDGLMKWISGLTKLFGILFLIGGVGKISVAIKTLMLAAKAGAAGLAFKGGALASGVHFLAGLGATGAKGLAMTGGIAKGAAAIGSTAGGTAAGAVVIPVLAAGIVTKLADAVEGKQTSNKWQQYEKLTGRGQNEYRELYWRSKMGKPQEGDKELYKELFAGMDGELGKMYDSAMLQPTEALKKAALAEWDEARKHNMKMMSLAMNQERQGERRAHKLMNDSQWIRDNVGRALGDFHAWMTETLNSNAFKNADEAKEARRAALEPLELMYQDMMMEKFTSPGTGLPKTSKSGNKHLDDAFMALMTPAGDKTGRLSEEEQALNKNKAMGAFFETQEKLAESTSSLATALIQLKDGRQAEFRPEVVIRNIDIKMVEGQRSARIGINFEDGTREERLANMDIIRRGGLIAE